MAEGRHNSHVVAWMLVILLVPVMYVLTFPFVEWFGWRYGARRGPEPKWLTAYGAPILSWFRNLWMHTVIG